MTWLSFRRARGPRARELPWSPALSRLSHLACLVAGLAGAPACGSRSNLLDASAGATGGASGTGGEGGAGTSTTSSSTTTTTAVCSGLQVQSPFVMSPPSGIVSLVRTALLPPENDVVFSVLTSAPANPDGQIVAGRMDAFGDWPPPVTDPVQIDTGVSDYDIGPGPEGPVALVRHPGVDTLLFQSFYPNPSWFEPPIDQANHILFVTAIQDRYFYAQVNDTPDAHVLAVGSYQPDGLPQTEDPLVCTKTPLLGSAIPLAQGFLAAFTAPAKPDGMCAPNNPTTGDTAVLGRYDSPPGNGTFLKRTEGVHFTPAPSEALVHLGLARAPFGAWLVYQTDGATALTPPPIQAVMLDETGQQIPPFDVYSLSPGGYVPPEVAVAAVGDDLAVAWIDAVDPSAPTIQIQLLHADGSPGPATSLSTNQAWISGDLRLLGSADGRKLLLSWVGPEIDASVAFARVDCIQAL